MGGIGRYKHLIELLKPEPVETPTGLALEWVHAGEIMAEIAKTDIDSSEQSGASRPHCCITINTREFTPIGPDWRLSFQGVTLEITKITRGEKRDPMEIQIETHNVI